MKNNGSQGKELEAEVVVGKIKISSRINFMVEWPATELISRLLQQLITLSTREHSQSRCLLYSSTDKHATGEADRSNAMKRIRKAGEKILGTVLWLLKLLLTSFQWCDLCSFL